MKQQYNNHSLRTKRGYMLNQQGDGNTILPLLCIDSRVMIHNVCCVPYDESLFLGTKRVVL